MAKDNKEIFEAIVSIGRDLNKFWEENQDRLKEITGSSTVSLADNQPLTHAQKKDGKIIISTDVSSRNSGEMSLEYKPKDSAMIIEAGGKRTKVRLPEDVLFNQASTEVNNGVLNVEMPRATEAEIEEGGDE